METIDKFKQELKNLVEKYDARLYTHYIQDYSGVYECDLRVDFPKTHSHTILEIYESIDYLEDIEQCTECGEVISSVDELENELCQSCLDEAIKCEQSYQDEMTESWNNR